MGIKSENNEIRQFRISLTVTMNVEIDKKMLSRRGKNLLVINKFKYSEFRTMSDGCITFRCTNKKFNCKARAITDSNVSRVLSVVNDHSHDAEADEDLEREEVRSTLKRKAEDNLFGKPNKLIRAELQNRATSELDHKDFKRLRESIYNERRKKIPAVPKTFEEAIQQLMDSDVTVEDKKFCYVSEDSIPIFTTPSNLKLLAKSDHVIADGTFTFLRGKSKNDYVNFWMNVKSLTLSLTKLNFKGSTFHLDFEKAAHTAIKDCFPDAMIFGCTFHLCQAWYRRIRDNKALRILYRKRNKEGVWLKSFFALCFLPPDMVYNAFTSLMMDAPTVASEFAYYVYTTYIEDGCSFPPSLWASSPPNNFLRTTNGAESFHSDFNNQFYSPRPNVHKVIQVLKEIQVETEMKKRSVKKGSTNPIKKKTQEILCEILLMWNNYTDDKDILKYLNEVSQRYSVENKQMSIASIGRTDDEE